MSWDPRQKGKAEARHRRASMAPAQTLVDQLAQAAAEGRKASAVFAALRTAARAADATLAGTTIASVRNEQKRGIDVMSRWLLRGAFVTAPEADSFFRGTN